MITGVPISSAEKALKAKTEAFGKYALELINEHRYGVQGKDLAAIEWSQDLFEVAYSHAKDISDGKAALQKLPDVTLKQNIQATSLSSVTNFF